VNWWFVFKQNAKFFPGCGSDPRPTSCLFGGTIQNYPVFGQSYVYASSENPTIQSGSGCVGDAVTDPVGATFSEIYNGNFNYVVWNDQFYGDPIATQASPWGHSKGILAWDNSGKGILIQVSTPSWPGSGSALVPRKTDGNTLGCVNDNDVKVSQHFFSLKLSEADVVKVLSGLQNASVVTDPSNPQIVKNGGPAEIQAIVSSLGTKSASHSYSNVVLSSGVRLISKPSNLAVPPWQMVSAILGGARLRAATWWAPPQIPSTDATTPVGCWDASLGKPGAVEIAQTGDWENNPIGLEGGPGPNFNHAKIGVTLTNNPSEAVAIFGDLNQQGSLSGPNCKSSQNGRGGLFYVVPNPTLAKGVSDLIHGGTAPVAAAQ
jgi:hypothetical protein